METDLYDADHAAFRDAVREFIEREVTPYQRQWEDDHLIPRDVWIAAGKQGLLGIGVPEEYGGGGQTDWRYRCVIMDEMARAGAASLNSGFGLNDDIVAPYLLDLGTDEQKSRWLPPFCRGELITAIAMTEPGAGSDLQGIRTTAVPDGDGWLLSGAKTFITNGIQADLVIVAARTDPDVGGAKGMSLLVVEEGMPGFSRGRRLDKIGLQGQDTAELFFDEVRVPKTNLLGVEGAGFQHLMERLPKERLSIAYFGQAVAEAALTWTLAYCRERTAFGGPLANLPTMRHRLAEIATEVEVTRAYVDRCVRALNAGRLTATDAAKAKWWVTELQNRTVDACLQLYGGYGYMLDYPIARAWLDARVQTIYGGTTEIMKEIIGRELVR